MTRDVISFGNVSIDAIFSAVARSYPEAWALINEYCFSLAANDIRAQCMAAAAASLHVMQRIFQSLSV
jgi:hypothetical protein